MPNIKSAKKRIQVIETKTLRNKMVKSKVKKKKEPINFMSLIISLMALVLGILLLFNGDDAFFNLLRYIVSGVLLATGIFKLLAYVIQRKKYNVPFSDCLSAIVLIGLAIFVFLCSDIIKLTIFDILIHLKLTFYFGIYGLPFASISKSAPFNVMV